jgi:hypothetical protein
MSLEDTSTATTLKKSLKGYKGHLSRTINSATRLCDFVQDKPSSLAATELEDASKDVKTTYSKLENILLELQQKDSANFDTYDEALISSKEKYDDILYKLMHVSANLFSAPQPQLVAAPEPHQGRHFRINEALKPFLLTKDHNPCELRSWINKFKAFYSTSMLDRCTLAEQHAYLRICLDSNLEARIQDKLEDEMPIFGEGGCIDLLEEEFRMTYPLFARRLDFFRFSQTQGQLFTDYCGKLRAKGEEADLHKLTIDELYVFRYICGTDDNKLKERFLKHEDPTLEVLNRIARAYEVTKSTLKAMETPSTSISQVNNKKKWNKQRGKPSATANSNNGYILIEDLYGRCFHCGQDHKTNDCTRQNLICNRCNKKGHIGPVCLGPNQRNSKANGRANSRAPSPQQDQSQ